MKPTEDEIWDEVDRLFNMPMRQPGDLDTSQLMEHFVCSGTAARSRMRKMADTGEWEIMMVQDRTSANGKRKVIRKVKKS